MSSLFGRWFAYGLGTRVGKAIFGDDEGDERRRDVTNEHVRQQTEEEILADERRYEEEAKRYEAEDEARRAAGKHR